jgi:plasmid segregation protein ParM
MNRQPKLLGLDIGFGFTKCVDGTRHVILPSCVSLDTDKAETGDKGHYGVALEGGDFLVGAPRGGPSLFENFAHRPERLFEMHGKCLALAAVANFAEEEYPLQIVVGLPISHVSQWDARLKDWLIGSHKIGVYQPDGQCSLKNIHIRKVHIVANPLGTFTGLILNHKGSIRPSTYQDKKIALVDVGFRTTDVMVMTATRVSNRGSITIDLGIANGFETIAQRLYRETHHQPDLDRLYSAIRLGFIRIENQEYNLKRLREKTFRTLSAALADRINYRLKDDWDVDNVLLTGGGASDLAEDLAPLIAGEVVMIEHDQDIRLNNVQGHLRLARHMWDTT